MVDKTQERITDELILLFLEVEMRGVGSSSPIYGR